MVECQWVHRVTIHPLEAACRVCWAPFWWLLDRGGTALNVVTTATWTRSPRLLLNMLDLEAPSIAGSSSNAPSRRVPVVSEARSEGCKFLPG